MNAREFERLVARIGTLPASAGAVTVVAIDGPSGSGKSTFADRLAAPIGASILRLEDLYPGWDGLAAATQRLVAEVLEPLARDEPAWIRTWDWERSVEGERRRVEVAPLMIIEGVGAGVRAAAPYTGLLLWLDASVEVRHARAMARDGEVFAPHWDRWVAQERALFERERTAERADLVYLTDGADWPSGSAQS